MDLKLNNQKKILYRVASKILQDHDVIHLHKITVILPSKRAGIFLKDHFKNLSNNNPIWIPRIITIDDFVKENSSLETIDNLELLFEFYKVYTKFEKEEAEEFDKFIKWAPTLIADFNEIDRYLIESSQIFKDLKNIKEIENWSFEKEDLSEIQSKYLSFWNKLKPLYDLLNSHLRKIGKNYRGQSYKEMANSIIDFVDNFDHNSIYFAGFNALSTAEQKIIDTLVINNKAQIFWDTDEFYVKNPKHEAGLFFRKHIERIGKEKFHWLNQRLNKESKEIHITSTANKIDQVKYIAEVLENIPKDEINDTAIVLADESLLMPVLNSIPTFIDSINVTMGISLKYTSIYDLIASVLDIQEGYLKFNKNVIYYKSFLKVLEHPIIKKSIAFDKIKNTLVKKNIAFISTQFIEKNIEVKELSNVLKQWSSPQEGIKMIGSFLELIKQLTANNLNTSKIELESIFAYDQLIASVYGLIEKHSFVKRIDTIRRLIQQKSSLETISFIGEPLSGLQVMGVLETRTLDFKNLIFLSVNEGSIPKSKNEFSFIPFDVKLQYKLPTYKEKDAIFGHHFYRLLHHPSKIWLTYSEVSDDFGAGEKSRYITQIENEFDKKLNTIHHHHFSYNANNLQSEVSFKKDEFTIEKLDLLIEYGLSPSAINTYLSCPLDFYYKYIIGVREEKEVEEDVEASTLGSIIHEVLEDFYKQNLNQIMTEDILNGYSKSIKDKTIEKFQKFEINHTQGQNLLMFQAAINSLERFINMERQSIKKNELIVIESEGEIDYTLDMSINGSEKQVKFKGTIDRVDKINKRTRIIDYKSGSVESSDVSIPEEFDKVTDKPKAFQLLLYSLLFHKKTKETDFDAGIFSFKKLNQGLIALKQNKSTGVTEEILSNFEQELSIVLSDMYDTTIDFKHNEKAKFCVFCNSK